MVSWESLGTSCGFLRGSRALSRYFGTLLGLFSILVKHFQEWLEPSFESLNALFVSQGALMEIIMNYSEFDLGYLGVL